MQQQAGVGDGRGLGRWGGRTVGFEKGKEER